MNDKKVRTESRYHQIAVAIAEKIADGTYQEGEKIRSRSTISGAFEVSPETARKAMSILSDLGIVETRQGSGVYVASRKKAAQFTDRYSSVRTIREIREEMHASIDRQTMELRHFEEVLRELEETTAKSKLALAFSPYEMRINEKCHHLNESVAGMNLWHNTGATLVAIERDGEYLVSPGPEAVLKEGDVIYFVGNVLAKQRMYNYLYQ